MKKQGEKKTTVTAPRLLSETTVFYSASRDANGLPVHNILSSGQITKKRLTTLVKRLVAQGRMEVVWEETDINPHIRRLPRRFRRAFEDAVERHDIGNACLYPTEHVIRQKIDLDKWKEEPYTTRLWLGGSHLDLVFFDLAVLEKYRNDPRYKYQQTFFGGTLSIGDEHYMDEAFPQKDKVSVSNFGIGYDAGYRRVIAVILSDLRGLSPEHQKIWQAYERTDHCKLNEGSFNAWFIGDFSEFGSIYEAFLEELHIINEMSQACFSEKLLNSEFTTPPRSFGVPLRPTQREFFEFARVLDLMLSENINIDFFPTSISRHTHTSPKLLKWAADNIARQPLRF